ncbi:FGFR1 oncogene partner-like isoform X1 [Varroa destructor]|uniref:FGFR1 oncogene partner (FOP) N-terminal dimerisation domain-containing protein n=1 Tax=Varroa destructor TaxID=109461 RepID=A0A7M7JIP6_VARDE|nr:FGFR1 oncogene partner-like isoform X1 [Varroa destructor]
MALNSEEADVELRDAVLQVLEESGALNKIKAELRCRVFQALYDSKQLRERVPRSRTSHFLTHSGTTEGRLILSLVKDLLQQLDLSFTLSVFDVEVNKAQTPLLSRKEMAAALNVDITTKTSLADEPLLSSLVKSALKQKDSSMEHTSADHLIRRTSLQLNASDVRSMFAEQSFFAQLDKGDDVQQSETTDMDAEGYEDKETANTVKIAAETTGSLKHELEDQPTDEQDIATKGPEKNNEVEVTISPPRSPEKVATDAKKTPGGKLSPLKPLSSLKDLPKLQAPSKLPSLKRPPPDPVKPLEGDSGDDVESLGEDLTSLGSDSATTTLEVSVSLAEIPGGDYVENTIDVR